jgi:hypothetical protein
MTSDQRKHFLVHEKANSVNEVHDYIMHPGEPIQDGIRNKEMSATEVYDHTSAHNHNIPTETREVEGHAPNPFRYVGLPERRI